MLTNMRSAKTKLCVIKPEQSGFGPNLNDAVEIDQASCDFQIKGHAFSPCSIALKVRPNAWPCKWSSCVVAVDGVSDPGRCALLPFFKLICKVYMMLQMDVCFPD